MKDDPIVVSRVDRGPRDPAQDSRVHGGTRARARVQGQRIACPDDLPSRRNAEGNPRSREKRRLKPLGGRQDARRRAGPPTRRRSPDSHLAAAAEPPWPVTCVLASARSLCDVRHRHPVRLVARSHSDVLSRPRRATLVHRWQSSQLCHPRDTVLQAWRSQARGGSRPRTQTRLRCRTRISATTLRALLCADCRGAGAFRSDRRRALPGRVVLVARSGDAPVDAVRSCLRDSAGTR